MLFTKVVHKNGTDVLFFPQYISGQTAVQNHGYSFSQEFTSERKHF